MSASASRLICRSACALGGSDEHSAAGLSPFMSSIFSSQWTQSPFSFSESALPHVVLTENTLDWWAEPKAKLRWLGPYQGVPGPPLLPTLAVQSALQGANLSEGVPEAWRRSESSQLSRIAAQFVPVASTWGALGLPPACCNGTISALSLRPRRLLKVWATSEVQYEGSRKCRRPQRRLGTWLERKLSLSLCAGFSNRGAISFFPESHPTPHHPSSWSISYFGFQAPLALHFPSPCSEWQLILAGYQPALCSALCTNSRATKVAFSSLNSLSMLTVQPQRLDLWK